MSKKNIAIIAGGDSSEYIISLKSAEGIYSFIDKEKYNLYVVLIKKGDWHVNLNNDTTVPIDKNDFSFKTGGRKIRFDFAYITIHGTPGENGRLQGYFDMIGLPYSSCGVLASSLTFNKFVCNNYLKSLGVCIADSVRLVNKQLPNPSEIVERLGLPVFVKPNDGGSSCGTTKVKSGEELIPAIKKAFDEGDEVIIESFMPGTEVTCGCYKIKGKTVIFPLTEVVSKNEFFDFEAKYNADKVDEITPARISGELTKQIQMLTSGIYDLVGAKGIIRVDYILSPQNEVKMLEVNTTPGMTSTSFIPQQIKAAGLDIKNVMTDIIENELNQ
ncbi:MAG: D-alanine--D-alanine ligase [Dysgonamonadaceae bacterium]|jgi:D-alanine-D-alanine ligase|nr:D-alanine--D-alanine ligase [Dysgonamonadaceae bacterium]